MILFSELKSKEKELEKKMRSFKQKYNDFNVKRQETIKNNYDEIWHFEEILTFYALQTGELLGDGIEYKDSTVVNFVSKTFNRELLGLPEPSNCKFRDLVTISCAEEEFTTFDEFINSTFSKFTPEEHLKYLDLAEKIKKERNPFSYDVETLTENLMTARLRLIYAGMIKESYARDIMLFHPKFRNGEYVLWELDADGDIQLTVDYMIHKKQEDIWVFLGVTGQPINSPKYPRKCDVIIEAGPKYKEKSFTILNSVYLPTIFNINKSLKEINDFQN
ncbi:hypothetical protein [Bacillus cereus]|uniref:hypothetical protein n=1 Tax=Bacillus cereus TaxID=1396 RepID=UPI000B4BFD2A|nr:hypothetical protein [Bacillus cereus]